MMSPEILIAIETFRKAFERCDALGVNVKTQTPTLPGPLPNEGYVIQMKNLMFVKRIAPHPIVEEVLLVP